MQNFLEYLNTKGTTVEKPKEKLVADEVDIPKGRDTKPPKFEGESGSANPYVSDGKKVKKASEKGFGDEGDKDLKYDALKGTSGKAKILTAESLIQTVRNAILDDPRLLENLVASFHSAKLLGPLTAEMTQYRETFYHLSEIMANESYGPEICDKFAKALKEDVSPPFGDEDEEIEGADGSGADFEGDGEQEDEVLDDEEVPMDDEMPMDGAEEPGLDGMGPLPKPEPPMGHPKPKMPPMGRALEHLTHSIRKRFI